jgi:tRNA dimethylallyltransferase
MPKQAANRAALPLLAAIVGPTASGKSALAMALARRLALEIVVADSRQVFRGMDIGTAKPDAAARAAVPHHLLDLVDPDEPFTVADWVKRAHRVIDEITARGRLPLVVGGTGLYLRALVDGYDFGPGPAPVELREGLRRQLDGEGLAASLARLDAIDPAAGARVDRTNPRRVLRALERAVLAGGPVTPTRTPFNGRVAMIGISRPASVLADRIAARTERMFDAGLVREVGALRAAGYGPELPALAGHGYREAALLGVGEWTHDQAVAATVRRTRQYARRQMTWLRADRRIVWLSAADRPADAPEIVARASDLLGALLAG